MRRAEKKISIGVSACLLGDEVRYDGGHKRDRFLTDVLAEFVRFVRVCPEFEFGLGAPRETLSLHRRADGLRMIGNESGRDITLGMRRFSAQRVGLLAPEALRGFVLKKGSPSCGIERVKVLDRDMAPAEDGSGLFAAALREARPNLPLADEERLSEPIPRENFMTRIFAYDRWLTLRESSPGPNDLAVFHSAHEMLLLAHEPGGNRHLDLLVARSVSAELEPLLDEYEARFTAVLAIAATPERHIGVLERLFVSMKSDLSAGEEKELLALLEQYGEGRVPLITVRDLLKHLLERSGSGLRDARAYLEPYPASLASQISQL